MAKTKTPFFSMGAQGSVGESITAQKRDSQTLMREKPLPTDPRSLNQMYQRWLYEDYAYRWRQQSEATQAEYRTAGVRFHLTGFQYWMKVQLAGLPDLDGLWHLDNPSGAQYLDFSKQGNNATIFGASPTSGLIDRASHFDGTNDFLHFPYHPSLLMTAPFSLEFFIKCLHVPDFASAWGEFLFHKASSFFISIKGTAGGKAFIRTYFWGAFASYTSPEFWPQDSHHMVFTHNGLLLRHSLDGAYFGSSVAVGTIIENTTEMRLAQKYADGEWFYGDIDHLIKYNRVIDDTEILRHSERRYPAQ